MAKVVAKVVKKPVAKKPEPKAKLREPMTKSAIIAEMSASLSFPRNGVNNFFSLLSEIAYDEAQKAGSFIIPGLGKLVVIDKKARMGRNPATGETIKIPAKKAVKFRVSKACKEAILPPKKK